jgi:hypothetical protein
MLTKNKIVAIAAVLIAVLGVSIVAALTLSNTLSAHWTVVSGTPLTLSFAYGPTYNGNNIPWGTWDEFELEIQNPTAATFSSVYVTLTLTQDGGHAIPSGAFQIQWYDGSAWHILDVSSWTTYGTGTVSGTLWNVGPVGPGATIYMYFQIMFDSTMPAGSGSDGGVSASFVCSE